MISGIFRSTIWNRTPDRMRGRLAGIEMVSFSTGPLLGNVESGVVASLAGVRASVVSGGVLCIAGVVVTSLCLPRFLRYDDRRDAPDLRISGMIRGMASHTGQRAETYPWSLVHRPGGGRARARADLRPQLAVRRPPRPAAAAGIVLRERRRPDPDRRHPRPRRGAAGVPERLPPPRLPGGPAARAAATACSARTTPGRTASTAGCGRRRARTRRTGSSSDELGLRPASVDTWGPLVFVNPDPDAAPLHETLGSLPAIVAEHGLDLDALAFHERVPYVIPGNWKIAVENYLECYHCELNHPGLMSVVDEDRYTLSSEGLHSSQVTPVNPAALDPAPARRTTCAASSPRRTSTSSSRTSRSTSRRAARTCRSGRSSRGRRPRPRVASWTTSTRRARSAAWIAEFLEFDNQVGAEDRVLIEGVQRGRRQRPPAGGPDAAGLRAPDGPLPGPRASVARLSEVA